MMTDQPKDKYAAEDDIEHLPLYYYDLTPRLIQQAKEELFEDNDTTETALTELKALIKDSKKKHIDFPTDDAELMPFLRARKFNVKKAHATYMKYFTQFSKHDKLFKNVDFSFIIRIGLANLTGYLPKRDYENCVVSVILCQNWNPSEFGFTDIIQSLSVSIIDIIRCPVTQITGMKAIVDCSGLSLSQLITIRPWHMMYLSEFIQKSTPLRFKGIHILNEGSFFYYAWRLLKPLLSEKMLNRVHFHGQDVKSLHRFFSPSILPEELGGNTGPHDTSSWMKTFAQSENYIISKINKFNTKKL